MDAPAIGSQNIGKQIDSLVKQFTTSETTKLVDPLKTKQKRYQNLSDGYDTLTTKLTALKSSLYVLRQTGTDSIFASKTTSSSNSDFVDATATSTASASGYDIRVNQLAKSDVAISPDMTSSTLNATASAGQAAMGRALNLQAMYLLHLQHLKQIKLRWKRLETQSPRTVR